MCAAVLCRVVWLQHCWVLYNEYLKCGKKLGVKNDKCWQLYKWANSMCPTDLMVSWYEARRDDKWYINMHNTRTHIQAPHTHYLYNTA